MSGRVTVHLLESPKGHSVLSWSFDDRDTIKIGRATDNDIVVSHPCVSRAHAVVSREGIAWRITSLSEQGIVMRAKKLREEWLTEDDEFRLGPAGPYIRFVVACDQSTSDHMTTYQIPPVGEVMLLTLDRDRLKREVSLITDDDYFRKIQLSVAELRARVASGPGSSTSAREGS